VDRARGARIVEAGREADQAPVAKLVTGSFEGAEVSMTPPARCFSPALLLLCGLLLPSPGRALDFKLIGGPGYVFWHSSVDGQVAHLNGYAHGISGVGFFQFGDHLRFSSGMLHGIQTFSDHSVIDRHFFFAGLRGVLPLYSKIYLTGGLDAGVSHFELAEALGKDSQGATRMSFSDSWQPALHPIVSVGYNPAPKYRFEMMVGMPLEFRDERLHSSLTAMLGLLFWMGK